MGELMVDFISTEPVESLAAAGRFEPFVGGQSANVAHNVARLGGRSALVARVGADGFGALCVQKLAAAEVDVSFVAADYGNHTTMAVIGRSAGTPDFLICRGADRALTPSDLPMAALRSARAVHASAFVLSHEPSRSAVLKAFRTAQQAGAIVSLDPTYHPRVWGPEQDPIPVLREAYRYVTVTKPSLDDCHRMFGPGRTPEEYASQFLALGPQLVVLTLGAGGALLATAGGKLQHFPARRVEVADVTGAGDAFWSGLLMGLLDGLPAEASVLAGMEVARTKIQQVGPISARLDRHALYRAAGLFPAHPA